MSKLFAPAKLNLYRAFRSKQGADYLAGGLALGAFWLWTPIWLLHFPAALVTASWSRVSKLAAVAMVCLSNPVTVAPIQLTNLLVGVTLTPGSNPDSPLRNPSQLVSDPLSIFSLDLHDYFTLCLGSLVTGTVASLVVWAVARRWAWGVHRRRHRRHMARSARADG
ncbi:MAG: DUF2062 domain-containing protein [Deltaproteobacteria bacterium]|nr:DUF2062 domain-containing protein [Deltaproteobacteria bacterium]